MGDRHTDRNLPTFNLTKITSVNFRFICNFFLGFTQSIAFFAKGCGQFLIDFFELDFGWHSIYTVGYCQQLSIGYSRQNAD